VKNIALALFVFATLLLIVFPCPPWSLKSTIAQRAQCVSNLKQILKALDDQKVPLDETHADEVRRTIERLNLECMEGTGLRGRPATYSVQARNATYMISEERDNHPARSRFMAGSVPEEQFGIDAAGKLTRDP
jgi:hypothetical protein